MPVTAIKIVEWDLVYYHFLGYCTGAELVKAVEAASQEPLDRAITVFNLLEGEIDIDRQDIAQIIKINRQLHQIGKITTHAAVLTRSRTLEIFVKTVELLSFGEQTEFGTFSSLAEGLTWVGLAEHEEELKGMLSNSRG